MSSNRSVCTYLNVNTTLSRQQKFLVDLDWNKQSADGGVDGSSKIFNLYLAINYIKKMSSLEKNAYDTEYFGFMAKQLSCERKHMMFTIFDGIVNAILGKISTTIDSNLLEGEKENVIQDMRIACVNECANLDELDKKYFTIPNYVVANNSNSKKRYTNLDEQQIDAEFNSLKQHFLEQSAMLSSLNIENEKYNSIEFLVHNELMIHEQLVDTCKTLDLRKLQQFINEQVL